MKTLGVIPARGGSKAIPMKNIRKLFGKNLILYTIEVALASKLTEVIVSTDSPDIMDICAPTGVSTPFLRPSELATDSAAAIDVAQHALKFMEDKAGSHYDALMLLQPTTPFRRIKDIDNAITRLEQTDADSVISVTEVGGYHPARMKFLEGDRLIDPPYCEEVENQPRQQLRPMYIRNGAIYLSKRQCILDGTFKGNDSRALVMSINYSINIDTEADFKYAEMLIRELHNENSAFRG